MSTTAIAPISERQPETRNLNRPTVQARHSQASEPFTHEMISRLAHTLYRIVPERTLPAT
jgi:hypothetical protein